MSNGNEPAYPVKRDKDIDRFVDDRHFGGLTKREAFAMAAMQGLCANPDAELAKADSPRIAQWAVNQADALLAALKEP